MLANWCVILYSMMILECWWHCCSVDSSMVVTLACLLKICMMCLAERRFKFEDVGGCIWIADDAGIF